MSEKRYFNRELSWIEFNYRVLEEALDKKNPLLERLKFLAIFSNNLDEFVMVRISGLISQVKSNYKELDPAGYTAEEVLARSETRIRELVLLQYECFTNEVLKGLEAEGFSFYNVNNTPKKYLEKLKELFLKKYFLILTPMAIDQAHPFPFIPSKTLNILAQIEAPDKDEPLFAIIPIPGRDRFIKIPDVKEPKYIYIGEFIKLFTEHFFKGYTVKKTCSFRVTRDAELSIDEEEAVDLLSTIESELKKRERGEAVRLEIEKSADQELVDFLYNNINFYKGFDFKIDGPLDLSSFFKIVEIDGYDHLKSKELPAITHKKFKSKNYDIFDLLKENDILMHHPYESFDPVVNFIKSAATDPKVLAIKQTLYRTSGDSPIIKALKTAAENGKQVTVLVELKARFDEAQNINWAKQLEQVGCHVVYGLVGLKTHCKIALIVRDEGEEIRRYIHLSTGNYNDKTAGIYTDIGLFTAKKSFGRDGSAIFNLLTGYSEPPRWKKLVTAPLDLRKFFLDQIEIEKDIAVQGGKAKIIAKMNALIDIEVIEALYEASQAGVEIVLIVRGMCRLRPEVDGLSENIKVISIVDRFLEHSRIYYFYNGGDENIYLASADWMDRNFDRRVEILFPVETPILKDEIKDVLEISLKDNVKSRSLTPTGIYERIKIVSKEHRSQVEMYNYYKQKNKNKDFAKTIFTPKSNPDDDV